MFDQVSQVFVSFFIIYFTLIVMFLIAVTKQSKIMLFLHIWPNSWDKPVAISNESINRMMN